MDALPIVYCRGFAGATSGIDSSVDDPFYGFNLGATHTRVNGDGDPRFYQFEGPMLRLMSEHDYRVLVHGSQAQFLTDAAPNSLDAKTIWISRFYDVAATTFQADPAAPMSPIHRFFAGIGHDVHDHLTADGFDIEKAATELYELVTAVIAKTNADKVNLVAHSMGGLVARCMMQKICEQDAHRKAKDIVGRLFTYATPHGGIQFTGGLLNWALETFGPAGGDIFSPAKMYGYLTPGAAFGDTPPDDAWDPRVIPPAVFDPDDVFCLIGTDFKDYGISRDLVGPQSDGLVQIRNAYVKNAHRAFAHKTHSGRYGEVNSEEGYQNLSRFLFGEWAVSVGLTGVAPNPHPTVAWQADLRLAIRGLCVLMTQQCAEHYNPIRLTQELGLGKGDSPGNPVPLVSTFLFTKEPPADLPASTVTAHGDAQTPAADGVPDAALLAAPVVGSGSPGNVLSRYALTLKVYQVAVAQGSGAFDFSDNLEQVGDWSDVLIVDVGSASAGGEFGVWTAWNSTVAGAINAEPRMPQEMELTAGKDAVLSGTVDLPDSAKELPIFGAGTKLSITITRR